MNKNNNVKLDNFLERFPVIKPPITLGEDSHLAFSKRNEPLQQLMIEQYILPLEGPLDEFTEYIPCFRIPDTYQFHAIVYWKAGLMDYQYILLTLTDKGEMIDKRVIAGTFSDGKTLTNSVATIDEEWMITVVSGQTNANGGKYDGRNSRATKLELLPEGNIIDSEE